jgi:hypothetical protein
VLVILRIQMLSLSSLNTVKELLNSLSWTKILQLAIVFSIIIVAWMSFENSTELYKYFSNPRFIKSMTVAAPLSKRSLESIDQAVANSELIVGIQVFLVNFQTNTRSIIYSSADNTELKSIFANAIGSKISYLPLFNTDPENNKTLVSVIDGDFICNKYDGSIIATVLPDTKSYIKSVCVTGIPPYYGKISGMISIFTNRPPTPEEVDQLRVLSRNLSTVIYNADLK